MQHSLRSERAPSAFPAAPPKKASADSKLMRALGDRLTGPGGLYNIGNVIALVAGVTASLLEVQDSTSWAEAVQAALFGSPAASWLTLALLIFIVGGEVYHRALSDPTPRKGLVRAGDALAALAAALAVSLIYLGDFVLALAAGVLLGGGRLGSALAPDGAWIIAVEAGVGRPNRTRVTFDGFRMASMLSRAPTLALLALEILRVILNGGPFSDATLPAVMFMCFLIWLRADILLTRAGSQGTERDSLTP